MTAPLHLSVFYGSYRRDRLGIRLATYAVDRLRKRGHVVELVDAKAVDLPMLDRMYKEFPKGQAPVAMEMPAATLRAADGFLFVAGEYNRGVQPGLKTSSITFWRSGSGGPSRS